jgi:hypothetical protein
MLRLFVFRAERETVESLGAKMSMRRINQIVLIKNILPFSSFRDPLFKIKYGLLFQPAENKKYRASPAFPG